MSLPIYFSHGYRPFEASINKYFGILIRQIGLLPSIDPPSNDVNSAKLERQLNYTCGLIAVICNRGQGEVSQYIMFEISLAIKSRKPLLVFIEDSLPSNLIPSFILQKRFAKRSYAREYYEHNHVLNIFKSYLGDKHLPKYSSRLKQKSILLLGIEKFGAQLHDLLNRYIENSGYTISELNSFAFQQTVMESEMHFNVADSYLAICNIDNITAINSYILGALQAIQTPTLLFSQNPKSHLNKSIPLEFQRRVIAKSDNQKGLHEIQEQIEVFEQDFIELDQDGKVEQYIAALSSSIDPLVKYTINYRNQITKVIMGHNFENISNSTIINESIVESAFNAIKSSHGEETATLLKLLIQKVKESDNVAAISLMNNFTEEIQKPKPERSKLKQIWDAIIAVLPTIPTVVEGVEKVTKLFM